MSGAPHRSLTAAAAAFVIVGLLTACSEPHPPPAPASDVRTPDSVTASGVLLAAVLLSTSDISAAIAEGLVTPAEVDAAIEAIDEGTLDEWRERAETELSER